MKKKKGKKKVDICKETLYVQMNSILAKTVDGTEHCNFVSSKSWHNTPISKYDPLGRPWSGKLQTMGDLYSFLQSARHRIEESLILDMRKEFKKLPWYKRLFNKF